MKLISHRGNINGPVPSLENKPNYIDFAISQGYFAEVDIREVRGKFFLGHDKPQYHVNIEWLMSRKDSLYVHVKDFITLEFMMSFSSISKLNFFYHDSDPAVVTSTGEVWVHPNSKPISGGIFVMPENRSFTKEDIIKANCSGVCSDYIQAFR
jgi:hypothetical protein